MGQIDKWITFEHRRPSKSGKTLLWDVCGVAIKNDLADGILGTVQWFPRWRTYAFFPASNTTFEKACLRLLADFCEDQTKLHRKKLKRTQ